MCECTEPGFCPVHQMFKNKALIEHCQKGEVCIFNGKLIEPPSYLKKISNYAIAKTKHLIAGSPEVTKQIYQQRIKICEECPFFDLSKRECDKCGCPVEEKCKWATEECPNEPPKWNSITGKGGCKSCGKR